MLAGGLRSWVVCAGPMLSRPVPDFRVAHQAALDDLLTQIVACLTHAGRRNPGGVAVTTAGNDFGQAVPVEAQVEKRTGQEPKAYLMDGGFASREDITSPESRDIRVYAPVRLPRNRPESERYEPRQGDSPEVVTWRARMADETAKEVYRKRGATAEWANAQVRLHGVSQFTVRGLAKVTTVMLMVAVAHNLLRWISLGT